jgi:hypothetical protein
MACICSSAFSYTRLILPPFTFQSNPIATKYSQQLAVLPGTSSRSLFLIQTLEPYAAHEPRINSSNKWSLFWSNLSNRQHLQSNLCAYHLFRYRHNPWPLLPLCVSAVCCRSITMIAVIGDRRDSSGAHVYRTRAYQQIYWRQFSSNQPVLTTCWSNCAIEIFDLLRCYAVYISSYLPTFRDNLSVPSPRVLQFIYVSRLLHWIIAELGL